MPSRYRANGVDYVAHADQHAPGGNDPVATTATTGGPAPATSVVSETGYGQAPNAGLAATYSRGDHTHGTPTGGYVQVQDEGAAMVQRPALNFTGVGVSLVDNPTSGRTDVSIPGGSGTPAASVISEVTFGQAASAGASAAYSRGDHTHGSPPAPSVPAAATTVSSGTTAGLAPAVGTMTSYAREDHNHGTPAAGGAGGATATFANIVKWGTD